MKSVRNRKIFNRLSLLLVFVLTIFTPGCGVSSSQGDGAGQYVLTPGKVDNFYVLSSDLDDARKPHNIRYLFTGTLQNNADHIYANGTIKMEVTIALENGKVLEEKDLNDVPFNNILSHKLFHNWKPGETIKINKVESISVPVEYADYPVKDVVLQYSLDLEDKINQTHEEIVIVSISVIDKWNLAFKRVKSGRADTDDYDFPDKVLNKTSSVSQPKKEGNKVLIDE